MNSFLRDFMTCFAALSVVCMYFALMAFMCIVLTAFHPLLALAGIITLMSLTLSAFRNFL